MMTIMVLLMRTLMIISEFISLPNVPLKPELPSTRSKLRAQTFVQLGHDNFKHLHPT